MKRILLSIPFLILCAFSSQDAVSGTPDNVKKEGRLTEKHRFNSVIPAKTVASLPSGTTMTGVEKDGLSYVLKFSDGSRARLGTHFSAYVDVDTDDNIMVNGRNSGHKIVDVPWYTISDKGTWVNQGTDTGIGIADISNAPKAKEPYVKYFIRTRKECKAIFSDGMTRILPYTFEYEMYAKKTEGRMDIYIGETGDTDFINYPFKKRFREYKENEYPSAIDNWGIGALNLCKKDGETFGGEVAIFLGGEAELAASVTDGKDPSKCTYVGGTLHGFESVKVENGKRQLMINVDGQEFGEADTFSLAKVNKIVISQKSEMCQAYTTTNPFAEVTRMWTFENGRLTVRIDMKILRDIEFAQAMFGMVCVLRRWEGDTKNKYLTRYAVKDSEPLKAYDVSDDFANNMQKDPAPRKITEYGEMGWSFALAVDEADPYTSGGMFVATNRNAYNKIYFDRVGKHYAKAGEVISAQVHWEIEKTRLLLDTQSDGK